MGDAAFQDSGAADAIGSAGAVIETVTITNVRNERRIAGLVTPD